MIFHFATPPASLSSVCLWAVACWLLGSLNFSFFLLLNMKPKESSVDFLFHILSKTTDHPKQTSRVDFSCDSYWSIHMHFYSNSHKPHTTVPTINAWIFFLNSFTPKSDQLQFSLSVSHQRYITVWRIWQ